MKSLRSRENGLLMTALVVGLGIVVVGVALTYLLRIPIENSIQEEAVYDAVATIRPHILELLSPEDLAQPMLGADYEAMNQMITEHHLLGPHASRLKLWNADGTVVYSTSREQVGETHPIGGHFAEAVAGKKAWELTSSTESPLDRELGNVLEVYIPLTWQEGGRAAGVLEVYLPYSHYTGLLATIRNSLFLAIAIASITLALALYILYRSGYRRIRMERDRAVQREREVSGLNRILQAEAVHSYEVSDRLADLKKDLVRGRVGTTDSPELARWLRQVEAQVGELLALSLDLAKSSPGTNVLPKDTSEQ